jgi:hypothetical protein
MARWDKPGTGLGTGGTGGNSIMTNQNIGLLGTDHIYGSDSTISGVLGESNTGPGVLGRSRIVYNAVPALPGSGHSDGVRGESGGNGVHGISNSPTDSGVWGENTGVGFGISGSSQNGIGVYGQGGSLAGRFDGGVQINGDLSLSGNLNLSSNGDILLSDCAEHFDFADADVEPGTVMVIDQASKLRCCTGPYDKKVAGVVSGAGNFRPGIILGRQQPACAEPPIALVGKTYCKVDARYAPVQVGDLLTTSATPGHAMKAIDPVESFGAVIGKALCSLEQGLGMIPILIALQ